MAKRRPTVFNLVAAVMCIAGVGFVSLGGDFTFSMRWGDAMTLLSAVFFALHMVMVPVFADRRDIMTITIVQIGTSGLCGIAIGALSEPTPAFSSLGIDFWVQLGYLVIFASCLAMVFQNVAQAKIPPAQASLLLSLESVFGVAFSVLLYGEELTWMLLAGFALIFCAIVISEIFPRPKKE